MYCRFTWQFMKSFEIVSRTEQGGCLGYSVISILDCHLVEGVWYIYD